ncbi:MAG TPA: hemerythrin domain-containing protein [Polyangia bacterium]|jgi:hemerythrin-like domain-containing protein
MNGPTIANRRMVLGVGTAFGLSVLGITARAAADKKGEEKEEDVGPGEDLMREHGVLRRVLLVYGEIGRRLERGGDFDVAALQKSARIVRKFIEEYHERQEEDFVFPRFERAHKLVELVRVLRAQHEAGRRVTERLQGVTAAGVKEPERRRQLRADLLAFIRMYEPHASREDTVLFPALRDIVSRSEYDALGEDFERREHKVFGQDGFEHAVAEIDAIEKTLGIEDLALFTPKA